MTHSTTALGGSRHICCFEDDAIRTTPYGFRTTNRYAYLDVCLRVCRLDCMQTKSVNGSYGQCLMYFLGGQCSAWAPENVSEPVPTGSVCRAIKQKVIFILPCICASLYEEEQHKLKETKSSTLLHLKGCTDKDALCKMIEAEGFCGTSRKRPCRDKQGSTRSTLWSDRAAVDYAACRAVRLDTRNLLGGI